MHVAARRWLKANDAGRCHVEVLIVVAMMLAAVLAVVVIASIARLDPPTRATHGAADDTRRAWLPWIPMAALDGTIHPGGGEAVRLPQREVVFEKSPWGMDGTPVDAAGGSIFEKSVSEKSRGEVAAIYRYLREARFHVEQSK